MALFKNIELENGVLVNYHRIISINKIINEKIIIQIGNYTSENKRKQEKEFRKNKENQNNILNVYINYSQIELEYQDKEEPIENYYKYLKTTEKYKDAEDV